MIFKQEKRTSVSLDQVDSPTNPKMDFEATEWDFGEIDQGDLLNMLLNLKILVQIHSLLQMLKDLVDVLFLNGLENLFLLEKQV